MAFRRTWATSHATFAATGFRSRLEVAVAKELEDHGIPYGYETARIAYCIPRHYIPDFTLPDQAIVIEVKGLFDSEDRAKMLRVKVEHPNLDIRFLFSNPFTRLGRSAKMTYAAWCSRHNFPFATGPQIPSEWLAHTPTPKQREVFERVTNGTKNN